MRMMRIALVSVLCWLGCQALRVDDKPGFTYCKTPHIGQLERVDVTGCNKWPCHIIPGRSGTYTITFTQNTDRPIVNMKSDIFAWIKLGFPNLGRKDAPSRIAMPGETDRPICPFTSPRCPVFPGVRTTVTKSITIPPQARLAQSPMLVELQLSDQNGHIITCFRAPVIVG